MSYLFFFFSFLIYTGAMILRHQWFQSSAWDLGIFDQAIYLISEGLTPISSLLGFHILGDHGALVLYPLGWISSLFPSVNLLFVLQGAALASSVFPLKKFAQQKKLSKKATAASFTMLALYPVIFNTAIFDFHPETLAFPLILESAVLIEERNKKNNFLIVIYLLLSMTCKVSISLLTFGIGAWLFIRKEKFIGSVICITSITWLTIIGGVLIPYYGGVNAQLTRHINKFGIEENSDFSQIEITKLIWKIFNQFASIANIEYILLIIIPIAYLLLYKNKGKILFWIIPFSPLLILNLASSESPLKDLVHHYSLLLIPFLALAVASTLAPGQNGIKKYPKIIQRKIPYIIIGWSIITFLLLSRISYFYGNYKNHFENISSRKEALSLIQKNTAVLTTNDLVPHLSRRINIRITSEEEFERINSYDQILLDDTSPGWLSSDEFVNQLKIKLKNNSDWEEKYNSKGIILFNHLRTLDKTK